MNRASMDSLVAALSSHTAIGRNIATPTLIRDQPSLAVSESSDSITTDKTLPHHSKYYFDDVPVIFKIENTLFKVHTHLLTRESDVFQTLFSCPPDQEGPEGVSDGRPIVLPGVKVKEFEALLDVLYEGVHTAADGLPSTWSPAKRKVGKRSWALIASLPSTTDRLISLLSIATRFDFQRVRTFAIDALEKRVSTIKPIDRICLARQYEVDRWLKPAYIQLCQRLEFLSEAEGDKLGMKTMVKIARAREAYGKARGVHRPSVIWDPTPSAAEPTFLATEAERIIAEIFFPESETRTPELRWL